MSVLYQRSRFAATELASPKVIHVYRRNAPRQAPCPQCGQLGRRRRPFLQRTVRGIAYHVIVLIHVTTAEYRATCTCCATFRTQIDGIEPKARYTNEIREAVLDRLLADHMNMELIQQALQRDFYLNLSEGFLYNCLDWKIGQLDGAAYRQWSLDHFSGTLCIDELHLGRYTLLLATDPLADFPVAFALVTHNDQDHMERFLHNLHRHGFQPRVVVTDGSNLYPKLLAAIWPAAAHQLCIFHVLKDINQCILDAVRRLQRRLRRRGNQGRRRGKGRPKDSARRQQRQTQKAKAGFVYKHRYLIVKRRDELTAAEARSLGTLFEYLPELRPLRAFVDEVYSLFAHGQTVEQSQRRYRALRSNSAAAAAADPDLAKALAMLEPEKFAKMIAYLRSPVGQRVRTNNHVERTNRRWRLLEKVRYKWRRQRSIVRFVVLMIHRQWPIIGQPTRSHPANKVGVATTEVPRRRLGSLALTPEQPDHAQAA